MTTTAGPARHCGDSQFYEIRLQGHLGSRWAEQMQGLTFTLESDGTTTLAGQLPDQAALHGLLSRIRDLGLPIISIRRVDPSKEEGTA